MTIVLTLSVLILVLISFVVEWLPVDLTALSVTVLLMILGLVTPNEGISGFGNSATITVMAMFILSAGITRTGVIQIVRDWLMKWGGTHPTQQIFIMGAIVGPISAFINNTAVVAIFLPIIEDWCKKQKIPVSKVLIPLSYASILGGMITLIGTSTNILASGLSEKLGYGAFTLFQFTKVGLIVFLIGLVYISFIAPYLLPKRTSNASDFLGENYEINDYLSEVIITPQSSLVGQTLRESEIQRKFDLDVLELVRDKVHLPQPVADKILREGDILMIRCSREDLLRIREERGLNILPYLQFKSDSIE
jgi:di/tricarboxylate transporter